MTAAGAPRLSAIVITHDEAANIEACLQSLAFCDERIVLDDGSTDETVALAERLGASVHHHAFAGFGAQKQAALALPAGDWVLSVDADERVTPELAEAIRAAIGSDAFDGYELSRQSSFCGRPMKHSGWFPDHVTRLARRDKARFTDDVVHERMVCDGRVGRLAGTLLHHPVRRLEDALARMDRYSTAGAQQVVERGGKVSFGTGIFRGIWTFVRTYFLQRGFLDGREGFLLAIANAEGTYYRYMKAWLAERGRG